jgi:hypothetical protein
MIRTKYRYNLHKDFETRKEAEHFIEEMKKVTSSFWSNIEEIKWNEITEKDVKHLVKSGDSLFGMQSIACGIKLTPGMVGYLEPDKVTCGVCKRTKLYKELIAEMQQES